MNYQLKPQEELAWGLTIAVSVYVTEVLVRFDPATIIDWRAWGIALFAGAVRAGAAALLVALGRGAVEKPTP